MLNYAIIAYARATTPGKGKMGLTVRLEEEEKTFQKRLHNLRNKVFAHLDEYVESDDLQFYHESLVLVHSGFGGCRIKLANGRGLGNDVFLQELADHTSSLAMKMGEKCHELSQEFGTKLQYLTFLDPELGNIVEALPFDANGFFQDEERARAFLYGDA